jgi:CheY-like chemotaxis protein
MDVDCLRDKRVLVVEDELIIAMVYEHWLQTLGCRMLGPVGTVSEALSFLEDELPDAVLLDANLRGQLSSPVAQALRDRGIPFLVVTGYVDRVLPDPHLRTAPCLAKPFDERDLIQRMAETFC